jgi:hypothetical protein
MTTGDRRPRMPGGVDMPSTKPSDWQAVDEFAAEGPLRALEAAVAGAGVAGERFQSGEGGRALLLPARPLDQGKVPGIAVTGAASGAEALVFLDPASGAGAVGLLAALGDRASALRVALPDDADPAGLVGEAGSVSVATGAGAPVRYRLFAAGPDAKVLRRPSGAPKLGEGDDVLDQRGDWFQRREGGRA